MRSISLVLIFLAIGLALGQDEGNSTTPTPEPTPNVPPGSTYYDDKYPYRQPGDSESASILIKFTYYPDVIPNELELEDIISAYLDIETNSIFVIAINSFEASIKVCADTVDELLNGIVSGDYFFIGTSLQAAEVVNVEWFTECTEFYFEPIGDGISQTILPSSASSVPDNNNNNQNNEGNIVTVSFMLLSLVVVMVV